jgi:hypothetical protein
MVEAWAIDTATALELRTMLAWWRSCMGRPALPQRGLPGVILPPPPWQFGKLDGALAVAGSATVSLWTWNGAALADSGDNQLSYAPPLLSGGSIASGKFVRIEYHGGANRWYVVSAEC